MINESVHFDNLKEFAFYCLHHKFDELCQDYLLKLTELRGSTQSVFAIYSDEQIHDYCKLRLKEFLNNAITGSLTNELQQIQFNELLQTGQIRLLPEELIWDLAARKNSLLNHLSSFTTDLHLCLAVTKELSLCNVLLEGEIIKLFQFKNISDNENLLSVIKQDYVTEQDVIDIISSNSEQGIFVFDKDLRISLWNTTMERMNGITKERALGKTIIELFPNYKNQPEEFAFKEALNGNKVMLGGKEFKNIDFFQAKIMPVKSKNGIYGGITIISDTSRKWYIENRLSQKENSIKELQEFVHLGTWEWVVKHNRIILSEQSYHILGYDSKDEISVSELFNLFDEEKDLVKAVFINSMNNLAPIDFEAKVNRKDGQDCFIRVKGKVLAYKNGVPYRIVGHCWDITDRKAIEGALFRKNHELAEKNYELGIIHNQLKKMNDELEQRVAERTRQLYSINESLSIEISERKKMEQALKDRNLELQRINDDLDRFVYTASHDLKAPISNIEGLVSTLLFEMNDLKGENVQVIDLIKQSILKFKETINDLADIGKSNSTEGDVNNIDIRIILDEVKLSIKNLIQSSNACFKDSGIIHPYIRFSKGNLKSILFNLVSNAIKYKHPDRNPEIEVECYLEANYFVLSVKDNGLGLSNENKAKVFDMFTRVHEHVEGTGIGLYLVKRIIDTNGGKVVLESEEGIGSTFKVFLKQS